MQDKLKALKNKGLYFEAFTLFDKEEYKNAFFAILTYIMDDNFTNASDEDKERSFMLLGTSAEKCKKKDIVYPLVRVMKLFRENNNDNAKQS